MNGSPSCAGLPKAAVLVHFVKRHPTARQSRRAVTAGAGTVMIGDGDLWGE